MGTYHIIQESYKIIGKTTAPLLLLSGLKDELIPHFHMKELHVLAEKRTSGVCRLVTFPEGGHNDTVLQDEYFNEVVKFLNDACGSR
jgi:fermentation-respiration switch protein FrsA (DUF1100 family)